MMYQRKHTLIYGLFLMTFLYFLGAGITWAATMKIGNISGVIGTEVKLPVEIDCREGEGLTAACFDIAYDATELIFKGIKIGPALEAAKKTLASSLPADGSIRILFYTTPAAGEEDLTVCDGQILSILFEISQEALPREQLILFSHISASDNNAQRISTTGLDGSIIITNYVRPPSAPDNLQTIPMSSSVIRLSWSDNSDNEEGFRIQRAGFQSGPWGDMATTGAGVTSYEDTGLAAATTYYYRVYAYNTAGDSGYSNTESGTTKTEVTLPDTPGDLSAEAFSSTGIMLKWSDNSDNEKGFEVWRCSSLEAWRRIDALSENNVSYTDSGLTPATRYTYTVRAYNSAGYSGWATPYAQATTQKSNTPPVAQSQAISLDEDTSVAITLKAEDPDGDELTYTILDGPYYGVLTGQPPNITYTPYYDYFGSDSFTFRANDSIADSDTGCVSLTIIEADDIQKPCKYIKECGSSSIAEVSHADRTDGYRFTPLVDGWITKLGLLARGICKVRLWDSNKTVLAQAWVKSDLDNWYYTAIEPIEVKGGCTYTVSGYFAPYSEAFNSYSLIPNEGLSQAYGDIRVESGCYGNGDGFPSYDDASMIFGLADIEFCPVGEDLPSDAPIAVISANPLSGGIGLTVHFDGTGSKAENVEGYIWDFDERDGIQEDTLGETAYHTYDTQGVFVARLMVINSSNNLANTFYIDTDTVRISVDDIKPPSAPGNLQAAQINDSQVYLCWGASTDDMGVAGYRVYEKSLEIGTSPSTEFTHTECIIGETYTYTVTAFDASGNESHPSDEVSITIKDSNQPIPQKPWQENENGNEYDAVLKTKSVVGYRFTPLVDGWITKLYGYFYGYKMISLWDSYKNLLASARVLSDYNWNFAELADPVKVKAGRIYTVSVYLESGEGILMTDINPLPQDYGDIRIQTGCSGRKTGRQTEYPIENGYSMVILKQYQGIDPSTCLMGLVDIEFVPSKP